MKLSYAFATSIGAMTIVANSSAVTQLLFQGEAPPADAVAGESAVLNEAAAQLREYLTGDRRFFTVPLAPAGTDFMLKVWASLTAIPYGETRSYQAIAQSIGRPKACRAVGLANHRNPLPLFIPCHRVVGANGKLTGYRGGLPAKQYLLELEQRHAQF